LIISDLAAVAQGNDSDDPRLADPDVCAVDAELRSYLTGTP
jgi:hypothetical protein